MSEGQAHRQPWLHDLVASIHAPVQVWSAASGQVCGDGVTGYLASDVRVLRRAVLSLDGVEPVAVAHSASTPDHAEFVGLARGVGNPGADPTVRVVRSRHLEDAQVTETVEVQSWAVVPIRVRLGLVVSADLAPLDAIKLGVAPALYPDIAPQPMDGGVSWTHGAGRSRLSAPGALVRIDGSDAGLTWDVEVAAGHRVAVRWAVTWTLPRPSPASSSPASSSPGSSSPGSSSPGLSSPGSSSPELPSPAVTRPQPHAMDSAPAPIRSHLPELRIVGDDRRWSAVVSRALADLDGLRMSFAPHTGHDFAAAGAPWFLTLFGRDSLWAARMILPLTTDLAASTLRVLATLQGTRHDPVTAEAPGKILHEVRAEGFALTDTDSGGEARSLPPVYYGSIDATPLWILTLADAWRWAMPAAEVEELLPALEAALTWLLEIADVDGDGFVEYVDESGRGLANQGWKDSGDAVRHRDGAQAAPPIALCEVQAYAYAAACAGADLLDAFARPGAAAARAWAGKLRHAFRSAFWVHDDRGAFPAVALDVTKRPVASLTSNIGHLLGTGLLDERESGLVADRLSAPDMFSGFGIRTLSALAEGYSPTGYHVGSVWPHDTAIGVHGLARIGSAAAGVVADGLLAAMHAFEGRIPELFAGDDRIDQPTPVPYPASCRPQAWSAAAAVSVLSAVLGLSPVGGTLTARPVSPWPFGALSVTGFRVGDRVFRVDVTAAGVARVTVAD